MEIMICRDIVPITMPTDVGLPRLAATVNIQTPRNHDTTAKSEASRKASGNEWSTRSMTPKPIAQRVVRIATATKFLPA